MLVVLTAVEAAKVESSLSTYLLPRKREGHDWDDSHVIQRVDERVSQSTMHDLQCYPYEEMTLMQLHIGVEKATTTTLLTAHLSSGIGNRNCLHRECRTPPACHTRGSLSPISSADALMKVI